MNDKTVLVTGSNKGIGFATLKKLSNSGAKIFACVRKIDRNFLDSIGKLNDKNIVPIEFDLNDREQVKKALTEIKDKTKKIDMLVNNAAAIDTALLQMTTDQKIKVLFEILNLGPASILYCNLKLLFSVNSIVLSLIFTW